MHIKANSLQEAMLQAGFEPPVHIFTGKLERWATDPAKPHSKDGWYVSLDGDSAVFSSWRDADARYTWSRNGRELDGEKIERMEKIRQERLEEQEKSRENAAEKAVAAYEKALGQGNRYQSTYLAKKGIEIPEGVVSFEGFESSEFGFRGGRSMSGLLCPMRDNDGALRSLQIITDEKKLFMKGGQAFGCRHTLGDFGEKILVTEGIATGQSARQATGLPVVVVYSAANLPGVVRDIRKDHQDARILILADDDPTGREKAQIAAERSHCAVALPGGGHNDFNDLHLAEGLEAVAARISEALPDDCWRDELIVHYGKNESWYPSHVHNLQIILENDYPGTFSMDEFAGRCTLDGEEIDDVARVRLQAWLEKRWMSKLGVKVSSLESAILGACRRRCRHPVREYLDLLEWDREERVSRFLLELCGADDDDYHRAVSASLFLSAVARIKKPGAKVDTMLILHGPQGWGKTQLWADLFGPWCSEVTSSLHDKDFFQGLHGRWCADFGELDQFTRAESTRIKQILTQTHDHYRPPYGRTFVTLPRQCVFVGGTNEQSWMKDYTGGRRFLPVHMRRTADLEYVRANKDQLWAEACVRYERGESWWKIPNAEEHQENIRIEDLWEEPIAEFLGTIQGGTTIDEVASRALLIEKGRRSHFDGMRIGKVLSKLGWTRRRVRRGGRRCYEYRNQW